MNRRARAFPVDAFTRRDPAAAGLFGRSRP